MRVRNWLLAVISAQGGTCGPLNFVFCSDSALLEKNIQYLNHHTLTDIITFDYSEDLRISGDLFISIDRVRENALKMRLAETDEVHRVMVHGVLHLLGYGDKSAEERARMREMEDKSLSLRASFGL